MDVLFLKLTPSTQSVHSSSGGDFQESENLDLTLPNNFQSSQILAQQPIVTPELPDDFLSSRAPI